MSILNRNLLIGLLLFSLTQTSHAFLKIQGQQIVDSSGVPVMLRGYGLGGWLVPEGYMLKVPGFGSPTSIRSKIENLIGPQNTAQFYARYEANYVNAADIQQIAQWVFNSIRLTFHCKNFYDTGSVTLKLILMK